MPYKMRGSNSAELLLLVPTASEPYHHGMRVLFAFVMLTAACFAQTTRKPFFPLPSKLSEFPTATLSPELRTAIAPAINASSCKPNGNEKYGVAEVELQGEGHLTLVRVDEPCLCGPSGNCPIYAIQKNKLVLPDGEGFAYSLSPNPKGGAPELLVASHMSAKVTSLQRYQWKGNRFKLRDCEATVPKDDAKSTTWTPEELEITSCDTIALK